MRYDAINMASSNSILVYNGKVLLILRDDKPNIPESKTWQLPGGGTQIGEDHSQTIKRELQEEIGVVPQQLRYLGSAPGETKVFFAFLTDEEVKNIKLGNEGQRLEFFNLENALTVNLTKKLRFYLEKFKEGISELISNGLIDDVSKIGLSK